VFLRLEWPRTPPGLGRGRRAEADRGSSRHGGHLRGGLDTHPAEVEQSAVLLPGRSLPCRHGCRRRPRSRRRPHRWRPYGQPASWR